MNNKRFRSILVIIFMMTLVIELFPAVDVQAKECTNNGVIYGVNDVTIQVGDKFDSMANIKAFEDNGNGKDVTELIEIEGYVDTSEAGQYKLIYRLVNECGTAVSKTRTITVLANNPEPVCEGSTDGNTTCTPVNPNTTCEPFYIDEAGIPHGGCDAIIIAENVTLKIGEKFDVFKDVKAIDTGGTGRDITKSLMVKASEGSKSVDTNKTGEYRLIYSVKGENGNVVSKERIIKVISTKATKDAVIYANNITLKFGDKFDYFANVRAIDDGGTGKNITNLVTYFELITDHGALDTKKAGVYTIIYSVAGENGNIVQKGITVTVEKEPSKKMDAEIIANDVTIKVGEKFDAFKNVKAIDDGGTGRDITKSLIVKVSEGSKSVDINEAGEYKLTYSVKGENGNVVSKERIIKVISNKATKDAVIYANNITLKFGDKFDPLANVRAIDDGGTGKNITNLVTYSELITDYGALDTKKAGVYTIVYGVTGENGNYVQKEITVTVEKESSKKMDAEIIANNVTIKVGEKFDAFKNVKAIDDGGTGRDITKSLIVKVSEGSKSLDINKVGEYKLTYSVKGENGNVVSTYLPEQKTRYTA